LQVVRGAGDDEAGTYYGPFRGAIQLEEAIRELNDVLGLRDCAPALPMRYAEHLPGDGSWPRTPGCLRHEIGKCLGPCIGAVREAEYLERFGTAQAFLDGRDEAPLLPLRARMEAASAALEYERAAVLRDKLQRLESLREQFGRLRFALESLTFTYTIPGAEPSDSRSYVIRRGRVRHEAPTPRTTVQRRAFAAAVAAVVGSGDVAEPVRSAKARTTPTTDGAATIRATSVNPPALPMTVPGHEVDEVLLVAAWFKRHPGELERTVPLTP
jgi:excinuclease ABC subunit C